MRILLLAFLVIPGALLAEEYNEWALKPASAQMGKWCSEDQSRIMYSNAGWVPPDLKPCGTLQIKAMCDAFGKKFIGPADKAPYGYLDCNIGPRIMVNNKPVTHLDEPKQPESEISSKTKTAKAQKRDGYLDSLDDLLDGTDTSQSNQNGRDLGVSMEQLQSIIGPLLDEIAK